MTTIPHLLAAAALAGMISALVACDTGSRDNGIRDEADNDAAQDNASPPSDAERGPLPPNPAGPDAGQRRSPDVFDGEITAAAMRRAVGGFPIPFWLYKGGFAPLETNDFLPIPAEAIKHRALNPDLWTEWRRATDGVERKDGRNWVRLEYDDEYLALPNGTVIVGTFDYAYDIVGTTEKYRFYADRTFAHCKWYGGVVGTRPQNSSGTYEIEGFVMRLHEANGVNTANSLVYDPELRPNTLWLDGGATFKRVNNETATAPLACR